VDLFHGKFAQWQRILMTKVLRAAGRGHQQSDQAANYSDFRDGEWRVDKEVVAKRLGEGVVSRHQESDYEQNREEEPGLDAA
jgi:hypothetical protein